MKTMTPDYERAAIKATETLIKYNIGTAPIDPLPILKKTPGVLVFTFKEMSDKTSIDRKEILDQLGCKNQDAITTVFLECNKPRYVVTYNQMLSSGIINRALARELGHIILGHDGSRPEDVRNEEAKCFAHHLLCPRPLIHSLQATGMKTTVEMIANVTGFYDYCLSCIRKQPSVKVPPELNRLVRDQFMPYIMNLFEYQRYASLKDGSALADFGNYMEGYEE
jgi:Zn-dependent peptidase ImmA (M78 family)